MRILDTATSYGGYTQSRWFVYMLEIGFGVPNSGFAIVPHDQEPSHADTEYGMLTKRTSSILLVALLVGVAACSEQESNNAQTAPKAEKPAQTETSTTGAKPAAQPKMANDIETVTNEACLAAVSNETGEKTVAVISNEFSEANSLVMVGVGANNAPWRCLVSNDGQVEEISFTGNDGDGVDEAPAGNAGSDVSQAAIDACLAAVSQETSESNVSVQSSEFSEANSLVMVGVGANNAPWRCLVSNDGQVEEISFTGDEGKL